MINEYRNIHDKFTLITYSDLNPKETIKELMQNRVNERTLILLGDSEKYDEFINEMDRLFGFSLYEMSHIKMYEVKCGKIELNYRLKNGMIYGKYDVAIIDYDGNNVYRALHKADRTYIYNGGIGAVEYLEGYVIKRAVFDRWVEKV